MTTSGNERILLSAYQCGPGMGSVSQIGWEWYQRLAQRAPTTLFTHVRNRGALEEAGGPIGESEIVYIDTEWFAGPLYRFAKRIFPRSEHAVFLVSSLDFFPFDASVVAEARRRLGAGAADWTVAHQVTPVSPWAPTRLARTGLPVVLGPLNGGLGDAPGFPEIMKEESGWLYPVRQLGRWLDAAVGSTRGASRILTATFATREAITPKYHDRCVSVLENGVDLSRFRAEPWPEPPGDGRPLRLLFVGRLIPVKGIPMLLDAVARFRARCPVELTIVGDGPLRDEWEGRSRELEVDDVVEFAGARSLDEVAAHMAGAHLFCLPSVRESGGAVLLEALAMARPCVTIDFGGPGEIVDDEVGRAIPPHRGAAAVTEALVECFADCLERPDVWRAKGEAGRQRAESAYSWDAKVESALELYREIPGKSPTLGLSPAPQH